MRIALAAGIILALAGCQTETGTRVAKLGAGAINKYCASSERLRAEARANVSPYLNPGVDIKITCPGDQ